jgi:predicted CoA-substrate-specific enzyme activase
MATGYGRTLFEVAYEEEKAIDTVTEIKAHARGVTAYFPDAAIILDIGGQDSKAIALNEKQKVKKFEMNDRCAAGTGKFLEIMARTLGFTIDDFGKEALLAQNDLTINSMCTVFAESEVTSLIAKGSDRREIAKGLHISVMKRAASMISRVRSIESSISRIKPSVIRPDKITEQEIKNSAKDDFIVFTGGVAKNECFLKNLAVMLLCLTILK